MLILARIILRVRDRRGFTLVETLVAMMTGVVVTGALFAILDVSVRQSSHLSGVAQATQAGRAEMTRIVEELHSACIKEEAAPVRSTSTPSKLVFWNAYDQKTASNEEPPSELQASGIHKDEVEYSEATHKLTDVRYTATSNEQTNGEYPWSATTTSYAISNVYPTEESPQAIFRYYEYKSSPEKATTAAASTLKEESLVSGSSELKESYKKVAAVAVAFKVGPQGKTEFKQAASVEKGSFAEFSTLNTLAFMAPNSEAKIEAGPCE
jgi:Tfp pilus assembly protein PilW